MKPEQLLTFNYEENKKQIFNTIVESIDLAITNKSDKIYIKQLKIINDLIDVAADKEEWPTCLNKALIFYKTIEDYEACAKCQKLIDTLTSKKNKN